MLSMWFSTVDGNGWTMRMLEVDGIQSLLGAVLNSGQPGPLIETAFAIVKYMIGTNMIRQFLEGPRYNCLIAQAHPLA